MNRQAMSLSLNDVEWLKGLIIAELEEVKKLGIKVLDRDLANIKIQVPIVNYETETEEGKMYCSDTWQFEKGEDNGM